MILLLTTGYVIDMYAQSQTIEVTGMVRDAEKIPLAGVRSEERRVGKECLRLCRSRWSPYH